MIVTLVVIAATCIVSFMAFRQRDLGRRLVLWPPAVTRERQWYRLFSYGLVHADAQHLLFNMFTLFFFGRAIERWFESYVGVLGFLGFYLGALLASILPSYIKHRHDRTYVSLGASGGVSAVLFAFILLQPWSQIIVFVLPVPAILYAVMYVAYSVYMDRRGGDNVNHSAHLWGAGYGVLFTIAMEPRVLPAFVGRLLRPHFGLG